MNDEIAGNPRGKRKQLSLSSLSLDPNNFRILDHPDYRHVEPDNVFKSSVQRRTEKIILGRNQENVRDLVASVEANGWLDIDQILVERRSGGNLVIEGNRRIAALKHLQQRHTEASVDLGKLDPAIFSRVPIVFHELADGGQQLVMMGLHHINGKRRWPAVNRALAIRRLKEYFDGDADATCNALGISKREFNLSIRTLALVDAYKDSEYSDQFHSDQFNLFREILSSAPIREWLRWNQNTCKAEDTINLERIFRWMSREPEQDSEDGEEASDVQAAVEPVLTTVGHIRELSKVINDPDAVRRLDETRSLQEATLSSGQLLKSEINRAFSTADDGVQQLTKRVSDLDKEDMHRVDHLIGKLQGLELARKRSPAMSNERLPWHPFNELTDSQFSRILVNRFRGISGVELQDLKRINLVVGINNSGKTSLLEAIYLLAHQNDENALFDVIRWRGRFEDRPGHLWLVEQIPACTRIEGNFDKGSNKDNATNLEIRRTFDLDEEVANHSNFLAKLVFESNYADHRQHTDVTLYSNLPMRVTYTDRRWLCRAAFTSPFWVSRTEALTEANEAALEAGTKSDVIDFISDRIDNKIENIELAGKFNRFIVSHPAFTPAPDLSTFGDGTRRIFEICLLVASVQGGVLLIDEFENAIHRDLLAPFARLVQQLARKLNVQVYLTTHSKEAVDAFIDSRNQIEDIAAFVLSFAESGAVVQRFEGSELRGFHEALDLDLRGL